MCTGYDLVIEFFEEETDLINFSRQAKGELERILQSSSWSTTNFVNFPSNQYTLSHDFSSGGYWTCQCMGGTRKSKRDFP